MRAKQWEITITVRSWAFCILGFSLVMLVLGSGCAVEDEASSVIDPTEVQQLADAEMEETTYCSNADGCCYSGGSCHMCRWPDGAGSVCCEQSGGGYYCCSWVANGSQSCGDAYGGY